MQRIHCVPVNLENVQECFNNLKKEHQGWYFTIQLQCFFDNRVPIMRILYADPDKVSEDEFDRYCDKYGDNGKGQ